MSYHAHWKVNRSSLACSLHRRRFDFRGKGYIYIYRTRALGADAEFGGSSALVEVMGADL